MPSLALLAVVVSCIFIEPPSTGEMRASWFAHVSYPVKDMVGVPQNSRIIFDGGAAFFLDETVHGPPLFSVVLEDALGNVIPHTRDGLVVIPDLMPPDTAMFVRQEPTADHPCPSCPPVEGLTHRFFTGSAGQDTFDVIDYSRPYFFDLYVTPPNVPPVVDSCGTGDAAHYDVRLIVPRFPLLHSGRLVTGRRGELLVTGRQALRSEGRSFDFSATEAIELDERAHVFAGLIVETASGLVELQNPARLVSNDYDDDDDDPHNLVRLERQCGLTAAAFIDTPDVLPRNAVVRVRSYAEPWPVAVDEGAPLERKGGDDDALDVFALPRDIAPGSHSILASTCETCACPACAPVARVIFVDDIIDASPPTPPVVLSAERALITPRAATPTCTAFGDVLFVTFTPGIDDHAATDALVYDVLVTTTDGASVTLATSVPGSPLGANVRVTVPLRALSDAAREQTLDVTVVARDLADNVSEPSEATTVQNALGACACLAPSARGAPAPLIALIVAASARGRRRR